MLSAGGKNTMWGPLSTGAPRKPQTGVCS